VSERNEIDIARLAHIDTRLAELVAQASELILERAQVLRGLSKANANLATGRKVHRTHEPRLDPVNDAIRPLLDSSNRQRAARRRSGA
jgi:hypothetical protein